MPSLAALGGEPVRKEPYLEWPVFDQRDIEAVTKVITTGRWGGFPYPGPNTFEFPRKFAEMQGGGFGVVMMNGTITMEVAMRTVGIGWGDVIVRTGGDEFIILLPEINEATAIQCAFRIREILKKKNKEGPHLSISFGTATATKGTSFTKVMKIADDQMYLEKTEKKNHQDMQVNSDQISLFR